MLFRLTQKLATKIKIGKRIEMPLEQNAFADWSAHIFVANRRQSILMSNTQSLYSCIMPGKGITNESTFVDEDKDLNEVGRCLNQTPLSALRDEEGRKYNSPDRAIKLLLNDASTE